LIKYHYRTIPFIYRFKEVQLAPKTSTPKRRVGLLVPSGYTVLEADLLRNAPDGWSFHSARMYLEDSSILSLARMLDEFAPTAARDLASVEPDLVIFASNSAAALRGNEVEDSLIRRLENIVHAPVISPMKAVRQVIKSMRLTHLAVITPYVNGINQQIRASLENDGFIVTRIEGLSLTHCRDMAKVHPDQITHLARLIMKESVPEALFICGSNLAILNHWKTLQSSIPCPVLTTNRIILEEILNFGM
jgi:maleate isomerase